VAGATHPVDQLTGDLFETVVDGWPGWCAEERAACATELGESRACGCCERTLARSLLANELTDGLQSQGNPFKREQG